MEAETTKMEGVMSQLANNTLPTQPVVQPERGDSWNNRYHVNAPISETKPLAFVYPLTEVDRVNLGKVGSYGTSLIAKLGGIDGVIEVEIGRYYVAVQIGRAFSWQLLKEPVAKLITEHIRLVLSDISCIKQACTQLQQADASAINPQSVLDDRPDPLLEVTSQHWSP